MSGTIRRRVPSRPPRSVENVIRDLHACAPKQLDCIAGRLIDSVLLAIETRSEPRLRAMPRLTQPLTVLLEIVLSVGAALSSTIPSGVYPAH